MTGHSAKVSLTFHPASHPGRTVNISHIGGGNFIARDLGGIPSPIMADTTGNLVIRVDDSRRIEEVRILDDLFAGREVRYVRI